MKRLLKSWVFWTFVMPPFALLLAWVSGLITRHESCRACLSTRSRTHGYVGWRRYTVQLTPKSDSRVESWFRRDFLPDSHVHSWGLVREWTSTLVFSETGVGSGAEARELAVFYESVPEFREFLREKVRRGEVAKDDVMEALRLPRYLEPPQRLDPEIQRLLSLGNSWKEEFSAARSSP